MALTYVRATIDAQNEWTEPMRIGNNELRGGGRKPIFAKAVMTDGATVSVQVKRPDETDWITIQELDQSDVYVGYLVGSWDLRIGVATGNFVSDDVEVEVGIG